MRNRPSQYSHKYRFNDNSYLNPAKQHMRSYFQEEQPDQFQQRRPSNFESTLTRNYDPNRSLTPVNTQKTIYNYNKQIQQNTNTPLAIYERSESKSGHQNKSSYSIPIDQNASKERTLTRNYQNQKTKNQSSQLEQKKTQQNQEAPNNKELKSEVEEILRRRKSQSYLYKSPFKKDTKEDQNLEAKNKKDEYLKDRSAKIMNEFQLRQKDLNIKKQQPKVPQTKTKYNYNKEGIQLRQQVQQRSITPVKNRPHTPKYNYRE